MKPIRKLLVANRSEIATSVSAAPMNWHSHRRHLFHEDRFALHRFKADEAYQIGKPGEPIRSYLDIDSIVDFANATKVDAVHPGYGFCRRTLRFAEALENAGIVFSSGHRSRPWKIWAIKSPLATLP